MAKKKVDPENKQAVETTGNDNVASVTPPNKAAPNKATAPTAVTTNATPQLQAVEPYSLLTDFDIGLFKSGKHYKLYEKLGSHVLEYKGVVGTYFSVWAPLLY